MTSSRSDGDSEPFNPDPFGDDDEYEPTIAFAMSAMRQAEDKLNQARSVVSDYLFDSAGGIISASAEKSCSEMLADMEAHRKEARASAEKAHDKYRESGMVAAVGEHVRRAVTALHHTVAAYDQIVITAAHIASLDPASSPPYSAPLPPIQTPSQSGAQVATQLGQWVAGERGASRGSLAVLKTTPGVGKTHQMLRIGISEQYNHKQRVIFAARTKAMILGDNPELVDRAHRLGPLGRVHLNVIVGRDADNCNNFDNVAAVSAMGYAPGRTVCMRCEYHPLNSYQVGLRPCGYFAERIAAHNLARGARSGMLTQYPFIMSTHAALIAAFGSGGGQYGGFWGADLILMDEDPTDAIESDDVLTASHASFTSTEVTHAPVNAAAAIFRKAIELGRAERADATATRYRAPGASEANTHPVHSSYGSAYAGRHLHALLDRAWASVAQTMNVPPLTVIMRDVSEGHSFNVEAGGLIGATSAEALAELEVPPVSVARVSEAILREAHHITTVKRLVFEKTQGRVVPGASADEVYANLDRYTDIEDHSYVVRLECLPTDISKQRTADEWRFVARAVTRLENSTSAIVIGDAYAQQAHYEHLFDRPAQIIETVSSLHPETRLLRILDTRTKIQQLRTGDLYEILGLAEHILRPSIVPGDRLLVYGHMELRPDVEKWLADLSDRLHLGTVAYEHWWGGRGKDQYNGWEHTLVISDPIQSLSAIEHVANARAFHAAAAAKTSDAKIEHTKRLALATSKREGIIHALRNSHWRISTEHDRVNVSEMTQAMHRGRPVHNPVNLYAIGEMELSQDILAQTSTVVPDIYRRAVVAASKTGKSSATSSAKRAVGSIEAFSTSQELMSAILAIIDHFGVFSTWFSHALLTTPKHLVVGVDEGDRLPTHRDPDGDGSSGSRPDVERELYTTVPESSMIPGQDSSDVKRSGGLKESLFKTTGSFHSTVIEQVWMPPTYWSNMVAQRALPNTLRDILTTLPNHPELHHAQTLRQPSWGGRRGPLPTLWWSRRSPIGSNPAAATRLFLDIVETQYGPMIDGRQVRPKLRFDLPISFREVPF